MPIEIGPYACAVYNDTSIFIVGGGGNNYPGTVINNFYEFNGTDYIALSAAPTKRFQASCVLKDNKLIIFGGRDESNFKLTSTEVYNFSDSTWYTTGNMSLYNYHHQSADYNSTHIATWGGYRTTMLVYEMSSDTWSDLGIVSFTSDYGSGVNINGDLFSMGDWDSTEIRKFDNSPLGRILSLNNLRRNRFL